MNFYHSVAGSLLRSILISLGALIVILLPPAMRSTPSVFTPFLFLALTFWFAAVFVRVKKPSDHLARRTYWLNMAFAGALAMRPPAGSVVPWGTDLEVICFSALPFLFLTTSAWMAHGRPLNGMAGLLGRVIGIVGLMVAILFVAAGLVAPTHLRWLMTAALGLIGAGCASGLGVLLHACGRPRSEHARGQVEVILLGTALAVLPLAGFWCEMGWGRGEAGP